MKLNKNRIHIIIKKAAAAFLAVTLMITAFAGCKKEESSQEIKLSPSQVLTEIFRLTKEEEYNEVAGYCRSFSPYSVELYFRDTGTEFEAGWTERYSKTLAKMFSSYVTYDPNMTEKLDIEGRTGTVKVKFTSIDLDSFNKATDSKINSELKNDFYAQMDYIDSVIGEESFKSKQFTLDVEFKYNDEEWIIADKNFLLLLTLGYYNK